MRNDLVGNIADYFKYGLLRALTNPSDGGEALQLGVVWFLDTSAGEKSKGGGWDYLGDKTGIFRECNPELFRKMQDFVIRTRRDVNNVALWRILPQGTLFFTKPLPGAQDAEVVSKGHKGAREIWLRAVLEGAEQAQLVFLDPNKGLEVKRTSPTEKSSKDYCFYPEVAAFWEKGKSLILFQSRWHVPAPVQVKARIDDLKAHVGGARFIEPVYFQHMLRGYLFFIIAQPAHADLLRQRLGGVREDWKPFIKRIG